MLYEVVKRTMFLLPPEKIHTFVFGMIKTLHLVPALGQLASSVFNYEDDILAQDLFGVHFPAPLGLAAGFDKNAAASDAWGPMGFGYAEMGTVTAAGQPGNPQPRLFRLPEDRALLNRMGFNNHGAGYAANNLRRRRGTTITGINIGKTKVVPPEEAVADYRTSARLVSALADYLVVNVSSPNTPGLRDLQAVESLRPILEGVQAVSEVPVLVKIAPDLSNEDIDAITDLALDLKLAGIIATNTTISREGLRTDAAKVAAMGSGGISGQPEKKRSLEVLDRIYAKTQGRIVLIGCGGIETVDDAWERITHGADLLQGYTAFIYQGPFWAHHIHKGLAKKLRKNGFSSISEAVGSAVT